MFANKTSRFPCFFFYNMLNFYLESACNVNTSTFFVYLKLKLCYYFVVVGCCVSM